MTPDDLRAIHARQEELKALRDGAMSDTDAAAHQLARYVSDEGASELANIGKDWRYLRKLVDLYNQSWLDYRSALRDWQDSVDAYNRAYDELQGQIAAR